MLPERKIMISFRLPLALVRRIDFIAGNTPDDALASRSAVILAAIETWLASPEAKRMEDAVKAHLKKLGAYIPEKK